MTETEEQTEFKFSELSEQAKDAARDANRDWNVHYDWWDYVYEDAVRMAAILGIEISHTVGGPRRLRQSIFPSPVSAPKATEHRLRAGTTSPPTLSPR